MAASVLTVALAGAGDMAKYFTEELLNDGRYNVVVLSRAKRPWFDSKSAINLQITDYSTASILEILNSTQASTLFSFLHSDEPSFYNRIHENFLEACRKSIKCKRLVPSEYGGNITDFPDLPRFYAPTHGEFRKVLRAQHEVEWTLVNHGWFMDYFVPPEKSYMKALPGVWPVDLMTQKALVLGSGDEKIGWTAARDVAKALVRLVEVDTWEEHTYVAGEVGTWNKALRILEEFHGQQFSRRIKSTQDIQKELEDRKFDESGLRKVTEMDEWNVTGASAVPWAEVVRQRETYFQDIKFRSINELLKDSNTTDTV